jgi:uncharacterized protein
VKILVGARWDGHKQTNSFLEAKKENLLDYIELSAPLAMGDEPLELGIPMYAHSTENPIASAFGLNEQVMNAVKKCADQYESPWIGEHLCFLAPDQSGAVGYVINPICNNDFKNISVKNIKQLQNFYKRPLAIELGPFYNIVGSYTDEIDFINTIAQEANCGIILDISHLIVSNRNLKRPDMFGFDKIDKSRVWEIHITGIRKSATRNVWHDHHGTVPDEETYLMLVSTIKSFVNLKAITLEVDERSSISDFKRSLKRLKHIVSESYDEKIDLLKKIQFEYTKTLFDYDYEIQLDKLKKYMNRVNLSNHSAEISGRRFLVAEEIIKRFPKSLELFFNRKACDAELFLTSKEISAFYTSNEFLKNFKKIPSAEGIGFGYENISKFYFWCKSNFKSRDFIEMLDLEFSVYLINQANCAIDPFFNRFKNGICTTNQDGKFDLLISKDLNIYEIDDETEKELRDTKIYVLDQLLLNVE